MPVYFFVGGAAGAAAVETVMVLVLLGRGSSTGRLMHAAEILSGPVPLLLRLFAAHVATVRIAVAALTIIGSLLTRTAWLAAGRGSAASGIRGIVIGDTPFTAA